MRKPLSGFVIEDLDDAVFPGYTFGKRFPVFSIVKLYFSVIKEHLQTRIHLK